MYTWVQMCSKTAILLEWNHIFVPLSTRNAFFWTTRALIGLTLTFYIALFITTQFYCTPREKIWDRWLPGTCLNRRLVDAPSGVFNAVLDLLIFALPQRVIWSLNMSMSKRLGVSLVFSLGLVYAFIHTPTCFILTMESAALLLAPSVGPYPTSPWTTSVT